MHKLIYKDQVKIAKKKGYIQVMDPLGDHFFEAQERSQNSYFLQLWRQIGKTL